MRRPPLLTTAALLATAALLVAGCDGHASKSEASATSSASSSSSISTSAGGGVVRHTEEAQASSSSASGRKEEVKNDLYEFEYSYPAKAAAIPALQALLDKRLATARAELEKTSKQDQAEAGKNDYPYRPHSYGADWKVVTDLPRWLSLSAEMYEYSGGAHGMTFYDAILWDREQNMARTASDLFISKAALSAAIRDSFCDALDKERAKRRGGPVNRNSGDEFDKCIDPAEHTVILGSSNGRTFDRIGVLVEPYAAGAYAEGVFDITVPVTDRIIGAVKPAYKSEFSAK